MNNCEQNHCSKTEKTLQYFCVLCDMELCGTCIFEHKEAYSLSGLKCDFEICHGSRKDNEM